MTAEGIPDESELIRRFKNGDEEAFRLLIDRCESILRMSVDRRLSQALKRRLSVADVLQEARLTAFKLRHEFENRGDGSFRKWLIAIVEREALRVIKRHAGASMRSVDQEISRCFRKDTAGYPGNDPSPSQVAIGAELSDLAMEAMATLSDDYQEVLHLTCVEQLCLDEAAERMGRSREAVRKLQGRALLRFTGIFERMRGDDHA